MEASEEIQLESYMKTALNIITYFEGEERDQLIKDLTEVVKKNCFLEAKLKHAKIISENYIKTYSCNEKSETEINEIFEKYEEEISALNPEILELRTVNEFMKHINNLCPNEQEQNSANDQDDEDMAISQTDVNVIDPFLKNKMSEPVKNVCGHVYDKASVTAIVRKNPKTRCPISGCKDKGFIDLSKLTVDWFTLCYLKKNST